MRGSKIQGFLFGVFIRIIVYWGLLVSIRIDVGHIVGAFGC